MKYTEEYLRNLAGLPLEDAERKVRDELGMKCDIYLSGSIISAIARDSVILYHRDEVVTKAIAGDYTKLDK